MSKYHANICKHICNLLQKKKVNLKKRKTAKRKKGNHTLILQKYCWEVQLQNLVKVKVFLHPQTRILVLGSVLALSNEFAKCPYENMVRILLLAFLLPVVDANILQFPIICNSEFLKHILKKNYFASNFFNFNSLS